MALVRSFRSLLPPFSQKEGLRGEESYSLIGEGSSSGEGLDDDEGMQEKQPPRGTLTSLIQNHLQRAAQLANSTAILKLLTTIFIALLPSFITGPCRRYLNRSNEPPSRAHHPLRPTAYLDGLRGVAALIVYGYHYLYAWYPVLARGYGSSEHETLFWQLPLVRVLLSGRASVMIFFVISGYVLTIKPLSLIHRGEHDKLFDTLSGSLFRRPFRLFLPIAASTGLTAILSQLGLLMRNERGKGVPISKNALDQLWTWWAWFVVTADPFRPNIKFHFSPFNAALWTIPYEMRGSVLVFMILLALSRTRAWFRMVGIVVLGCWLAAQDRLNLFLFVGGLFLAQLSLTLPPSTFAPYRESLAHRIGARKLWLLQHAVTAVVWLFSIHLLAWPQDHAPASLGYVAMSAWTPSIYTVDEFHMQHFWLSVGAMIFIAVLMYSPPLRPAASPARASVANGSERGAPLPPSSEPFLQSLFTNRVALYLGDISYSFYLLHLPLSNGIGMHWQGPALAAWKTALVTIAKQPDTGSPEAQAALDHALSAYVWASVPGILANTLVLFWVSDVFTRLVDVPSVNLTRRIWLWALGKTPA